MAVSKEIKEKALAKAKDIFDKSKSTVFVHFSKLEGNEVKDLRSEFIKENVKYTVLKKTLIKKTASEAGLKGELPQLDGEIALAYSTEDATAPARLVQEFSKKINNKIEIVGGVFEKVFKNKEEMQEIASIPSLDVLRGMFVNVINSPIQRCAIALGQISEKKEN